MRVLSTAKTFAHALSRARDVKNRTLRAISMLVTDRCSSRCKHCFIWNKKENHDLDLEIIEGILADDVVSRRTFFELTGGEFLEHPQWREIVAMMARAGNRYIVLSNGSSPDELIEAVREFRIPNVYMSLDGLGETYKRVRGVDWVDRIIKIVDAVKDITKIHLGYTITPWNSAEDLRQVKALAEEKGVEWSAGVYQNIEFFDTVKPVGKISPEHEPYLDNFMRLNNDWMDRKLSLPCWNIRTKCYVLGNGDVYLCQQKSVVLGNLHEKSLGEIWRSAETAATHRQYEKCNDCWLACNRPFDAELAHAGRLVFSAERLSRWFGEHSWDRVHEVYDRDGRPRHP